MPRPATPHQKTMDLNTSVAALNRVGKVLKNRLSNLGIQTVEDLLFHFPFRYEDYSNLITIDKLVDKQQVTIKGKIEAINTRRSPRKRTVITEAVVADHTEQINIVWFGQPYIKQTLKVGDTVFLSGKVKEGPFGLQMVSPMYEKEKPQTSTTHTARIVPMYPLTAGITQKQIRFLINQIISTAEQITEWLPEEILDKADLIHLPEAIKAIHFPETMEEMTVAERRIKFDELFLLQLRAARIRQAREEHRATPIHLHEKDVKAFVNALPFALTKDQKIAAWEILQDMAKTIPMNRLLEGDVGAGKTVVAGLAMYNCILDNKQATLMAPTEILALQHFQSLTNLLPDATICLLTGSQAIITNHDFSPKLSKKKQKETIKQMIAEGEVHIAVGTHALITDDVHFKTLGLVIVDEQHRFGVAQRKTIRDKSGNTQTAPHFLSMTATPIPRSFALTLYGDLDLSIIKTMPEGRKPIKTRVVEPKNRQKAYDFIRTQVQKGRQVFVVCPLIEEATDEEGVTKNAGERKTVMAEYEKLANIIFPNLNVQYLHGKLKSKEKEEIMAAFANKQYDILVSTSVIEVGVNIPNASIMMIEDAERFGLAQLHQFRGRVGRSIHQSYCLLFTQSDSQQTLERLTFFEKHTSGFDVAEYDLETRGPGEVYGMSQSGMQQFRLATMKDQALIKFARDIAQTIDFKKHPQLKKAVQNWEQKVHLE